MTAHGMTAPPRALVVMGVAGCGKSTLGADVAAALGWRLIEGDDHHAPSSVAKMRAGEPLSDDDRRGWLDRLASLSAEQLQPDAGASAGVVLTCSALKRAYRDRLRAGVPGLRFAWLALTQDESLRRVARRHGEHLFPPSLVASQFQTLEPPTDEAGVLELDATRSREALSRDVVSWLQAIAPTSPGAST